MDLVDSDVCVKFEDCWQSWVEICCYVVDDCCDLSVEGWKLFEFLPWLFVVQNSIKKNVIDKECWDDKLCSWPLFEVVEKLKI